MYWYLVRFVLFTIFRYRVPLYFLRAEPQPGTAVVDTQLSVFSVIAKTKRKSARFHCFLLMEHYTRHPATPIRLLAIDHSKPCSLLGHDFWHKQRYKQLNANYETCTGTTPLSQLDIRHN